MALSPSDCEYVYTILLSYLPLGGFSTENCLSSPLVVKVDDRGDPALSKLYLGFDSRLLLGSLRVREQQKTCTVDGFLSAAV